MNAARNNPPSEITLVYRPVGKKYVSHVFTAGEPELCGFHISSPNLRVAFDLAAVALGRHVTLLYGTQARYEIEHSFDEFEAHLASPVIEANQVRARITQGEFVNA